MGMWDVSILQNKAKLLLLVMKKMYLILCALCVCILASAQNKKIALLEPREGEGSSAITGIEKAMVRGELRKAIVNIPGYEAVTRADIDQMMKEHDFQRTGMVSSDQIKRLGILSGADYICVSTLTKSDTEFYLEAYLIHLETGTMSHPASQYGELVDGKLANMYPACQSLAKELLTGKTSSSNAFLLKNHTNSILKYDKQNYIESAWGIDMNMAWVEGGEFAMGCTPDQGGECSENEKNIRNIKLSGFYMGVLEVTQSQWEKVMGTTIYQQKSKAGYNSTYGVGSNYPMYYVNWNEANDFCRKLSEISGKKYTLPTEAQWEYAARGGLYADNFRYAGSNRVEDVAWYSGSSKAIVHPCGKKNANSLGLYDLSGNVSEWCADWYNSYYASDDTCDPRGPISGDFRIIRGGNWENKAQYCRVANRRYERPQNRSYLNGFRVVCIP